MRKDKGKLVEVLLCRVLVYAAAAAVIFLNLYLCYDNVVWGDEAFSMETGQKSLFGIMQILYYIDCHPPLFYVWLHLWIKAFGYHTWVGHAAAAFPFILEACFAATAVRKHLGAIPAYFLIFITGLSYSCVTYNVEIRMYSLAFFGLSLGSIGAMKVLCDAPKDKKNLRKHAAMLIAGCLIGAYSHYFALAAGGLLTAFTGFAYWIKNMSAGKQFKHMIIWVAAYILGYAPWIPMFIRQFTQVNSGWWLEENAKLSQVFNMLFGGEHMKWVLMPTCVILGIGIIFGEILDWYSHRKMGYHFTAEWYFMTVGALTVLSTMLFVYGYGYIGGSKIVVARYIYPLMGIVVIVFAEEISYYLRLENVGKGKDKIAYTLVLILLAGVIYCGGRDFLSIKHTSNLEEFKTNEFLDIVGEAGENTCFVSNGVKHLAWTVLTYYYPDSDIVTGTFDAKNGEKDIWYCDYNELPTENRKIMEEAGYEVFDYGEVRLSEYVFRLYHFVAIN